MGKLQKLEASGYDLDFLYKTQPIGNVKCTDNAIRIGSLWTASLYVYHLIEETSPLWLMPLTFISDGLVTIDVATQEEDKIEASLDKALLKSYRDVLSSIGVDKELAHERMEAIKALIKKVRKKISVMKFIKLRVHFWAATQDELEKKIETTRKKLEKEQFGVTLCLMEQKEEFQSRFIDYIVQDYLPNRRVGLDISSSEFGTSLPINYVSLQDKRGDYIGKTRTQGQFIFDRFELNGTHRTHYNIAVFGKMGVGKSTLLKKFFQDDARKGYLIYGFDKSGEYTNLINYYHGKIIHLDGIDGRINLFEILPLVTDDNNDIDMQGCYTNHINRLVTWYRMIHKDASTLVVEEFKSLLSRFYHHLGFVDSKGTILKQNIVDLSVSDYPILSEFITYIDTLTPEHTVQQNSWHTIHLILTNLMTSYGRLFDGYTQIQQLEKEQIVFFNIEGLNSIEKNIADAQIFLATTLFYAMQIKNGKEQMQLYKSGQCEWDYLRRSSLFVDECHNLLNVNNLHLVEFITTFMREARKMLISIVLSTQSISEMVSEKSDSIQKEALAKVFEFCQYVCYFNIKSNMLPLLKIISAGQLTDYHVMNIGNFLRGEFLISFDGSQAFEVKMDVTTEELQLFDGGGRNYG